MFRWLKQLLTTPEPPEHEAPPITGEEDTIKPHQKRVFGTRDFKLIVVGTSNYHQAIERATAGRKSYKGNRYYIPVVLEAEQDNPHDSNAVKVISLQRDTIGYLPREEAVKYTAAVQSWQDQGKWVGCDANVALDRKRPGIWLDLDIPEAIIQ